MVALLPVSMGVSVISTFESVWKPVSIPSQSQELAEMTQDQVSPNSMGLNAFKCDVKYYKSEIKPGRERENASKPELFSLRASALSPFSISRQHSQRGEVGEKVGTDSWISHQTACGAWRFELCSSWS